MYRNCSISCTYPLFSLTVTLSLGISGSATPFTTPNELQSNNESPYFQGHQPALQSENSGAEHPGVQQNMDNIDPNTMLFILAVSTNSGIPCLLIS